MATPALIFGTVARDVVDGVINLETTTILISAHGPAFLPVTGMTTTADLSDEVAGSGYTPQTLTGKDFTSTGPNTGKFVAAPTVWPALVPAVKTVVAATAAGRLLWAVEFPTLLDSNGGPGTVKWDVDVLAGTADPNANELARRGFTFLKNRPLAGATNRVIIGQHLAYGGSVSTGQAQFADILAQTGHLPMCMGIDLDSGSLNHGALIDAASAHAAAGGIIEASIHAHNFLDRTKNYEYPAGGDPAVVTAGWPDFRLFTNPANAQYDAWHAQLDSYTTTLLALQAAGCIVFLRLWHEMTAAKFWWSVRNPSMKGTATGMTSAQGNALWQLGFTQMIEHFWDAGVHNLVIVYSPQKADSLGTDTNGRHARFYVATHMDAVMPTTYTMNPFSGEASWLTDTHDRLPDVPFGMGEFGRPGTTVPGAGPMDMRLWTGLFKTLPWIAFAMTWNGYRGIQDNQFPNEFMDDLYLIKLGGITP